MTPNVVYSGVTEGEVLTAVQGIGTPGSASLMLILDNFHRQELDLRISQEIPYACFLDHKTSLFTLIYLMYLTLLMKIKVMLIIKDIAQDKFLDSDGLRCQGRIIITGTDTEVLQLIPMLQDIECN